MDITVPVPKGTRGKNLIVVIGKTHLSVGLKGQENILDGELCQEIKVEESTWTLGEFQYDINYHDLNYFAFCRRPGGRFYSPRKGQQNAVVGERP